MAETDLHPVCPECGYDLRGIASDRCPECGLAVDRAAVSRIPWVNRRPIGRVRAYWRTVWLATFRTDRLAAEVRRPLKIRDGQTFRWLTVALAWVPLGALAAWAAHALPLAAEAVAAVNFHIAPAGMIGYAETPLAPLPLGLSVPWLDGLQLPGVAPAAVLAALVLFTGVGSYFFHPRRLPVDWQNRAVAISYFACAPLALAALPAVAAAMLAWGYLDAGGNGRFWNPGNPLRLPLLVVLDVGTGFIALALAFAEVRLLRTATRVGWVRAMFTFGLAAVLSLASAAAALVAVPWMAGYLRLMAESFFA